MKKILFFIASLVFIVQSGYADSPLTSTEFYQAYLDVPIVKAAADNPNVLTEEMMIYLHDDANPLDIRIALINAVGWSIDGLSTFSDFVQYWVDNFLNTAYEEGQELNAVLYEATCDQMAVLVYLHAMADYFDTQSNYALMEYAMQTPLINKQSFMLPMGLILAQTSLDINDWGNIYPAMNFYLFSPTIKDVRPEAIEIIMDYINEYKKYADRP